jgi:hypothetical protein
MSGGKTRREAADLPDSNPFEVRDRQAQANRNDVITTGCTLPAGVGCKAGDVLTPIVAITRGNRLDS